MAIKRAKETVRDSIPTKLAEILLQAFSFQAIRDKYDEAFKGVKTDVTSYLEHNTDGFTVELSKGFTCDQGTVIYQSRSNYRFDTDKILALVEDGKLSLATLVNIANFNPEKLRTAIGETEFVGLATNHPTEYLTLRANSEFKASVEENFASVLPAVTVEEVVEERPAKKKATAAIIAKVKAAKKVDVDADEDLEMILNGGKK